MYDPISGNLSVCDLKTDTKPHQIKDMIFDETLLKKPFKVGSIFNNQLFITFETVETQVIPQLYSIDLNTGQTNAIDLTFALEPSIGFLEKEVEIVDETDDYFLVISSVDKMGITIQLDDYQSDLDYILFHYSLISKQDYMNSKPNYIKIEEI